MPSPFACSPVVCECSWKITQIKKTNKKNNNYLKNVKKIVKLVKENCKDTKLS